MFKKLKIIIPQSLLARMVLISILAMASSSVAIYIFYNRHWEKVTKYMIESLVGEVYSLTEIYKRNRSYNDIKPLENALRLKFFISKAQILSYEPPQEELKNLYFMLKKILSEKEISVTFYSKNTILIQIQLDHELIEIRAPRKKIDDISSYIFILWMIAISIISFCINIIFTKNQIRPIIKLAKVAELFGKGHKIEKFSITGAYEVKKASLAFLEMKSRIEKHVSQRTTMLNGISHDLRTPLTRIKLHIALSNHPELLEIKNEVDEMEILIDSYLNFTKNQENEKHTLLNPNKLIQEIISNKQNRNLKIDFIGNCKRQVKLKEILIRRAINNLIDNAEKFATHLIINTEIKNQCFIMNFDDNGVGIDESEHANVLKPFYKLDQSRNLNNTGSGLGLAIVEDVINIHGGNIKLGKSEKLKGLKIIIEIPMD